MPRPVGILATGACVPDRVLGNAELERMIDTSDEWIRSRTGIRERRIAAPAEAASDLAARAASDALARAGLAARDLRLIVVATVTPDHLCPPTACLLQHALGASHAAGFDLSAACSGFVNALLCAQGLVATGAFPNALVVGVDLLSRITDYQNRESCVLFGDGAGAVVIAPEAERGRLLDHSVGIDGSGADAIRVLAGGSAHPASARTVEGRQHYLAIDGRRVFKFAVTKIPEVVHGILARNGFTIDDLALLVPHQANLRILEAAAERLGIGMDRVVVNIERFGNTSSASVPLALHEAVTSGRLAPGQLACLVAFGGGLSWGASLLRW